MRKWDKNLMIFNITNTKIIYFVMKKKYIFFLRIINFNKTIYYMIYAIIEYENTQNIKSSK